MPLLNDKKKYIRNEHYEKRNESNRLQKKLAIKIQSPKYFFRKIHGKMLKYSVKQNIMCYNVMLKAYFLNTCTEIHNPI